ncbi:DNA sulfur modification protein DndB [Bradyrhizobium sp. Rc2d]|uniref:DNA sulfur modification protein DndB n=1 Tax=Bradyrhizobium sp. Rc2d TaxID=1855321 RepID=UPI0008811FDA|nr:DNA sulfur modification protein DndB [Bradyrhizobium sp. Rc2d]SDG87493.1 DNA sulfur modification protein DndB [Bradyrhizobium sp. Rc2d]
MSTISTTHTKPLNPTDGHIIAGTAIDENRFIGRVRASQLFQIAPDPRDSENKKKLDASHELQELRGIRDEVQRLFEGAKKKNVEPYADYIVALRNGQDGLTPAITLYCEAPLLVEMREDGTAFIQVPWDKRLVAIDGETQLAARHEAANLDPETKKDFVPIYINHGRDEGWARQAFHDLNTLGVRPNAALSLGMDARDPITRVCREVERHVGFFKGRVNKVRRQLRSTDAEVVTITTLRGACVTLAKGINGVQYGARPVPVPEETINAIERAAIDWFNALTEAYGPALENREHSLASSPTAMAALGAVGHPLVNVADPKDRALKARELVNSLSGVNWTRDKTWEGIAGKFTPKGSFSLGGSKETAYAVYATLTDPASAGYSRVRGGAASKAA